MAESVDDILKKFAEEQKNITSPQTMQWFLDQIKKSAKESLHGYDPDTAKTEEAKEHAGPEGTDSGATGGQSGQGEREKVREEIRKQTSSGTTNTFDTSKIGTLLFYTYDPKTKETLKYWDQFPLVIPVTFKQDGFIGLNLHYLPPNYRAILFANLLTIRNSAEMDVMTKLQITYETLKNVGRFRYFTPCIKRYLGNRIRSQMIMVNPIHWAKVIMMPSANFQKADEINVWQDSINQITKENNLWGQGGRKRQP